MDQRDDRPLPEIIRQRHAACIDHASDLLRSALGALSRDGLPNVAYHLAVLALEEIGKAGLICMHWISGEWTEQKPFLLKHADDHVRKIFWAIWGPLFGKEQITKQQIEDFEGLARHIHETRKAGLYVATDATDIVPKDAVSREDAERLIALVNTQIEIARNTQPLVLDETRRENIAWLMRATEDPETRRLIMGSPSMKKMAEVGVTDWILWLREQFAAAEREATEIAAREMSRPQGTGVHTKWRITIRLYSASHTVRPKELNAWNSACKWIALRPVDKKKDQILVDFALLDSITAQALWPYGWFVSRAFLAALNIGTMGFFWWYLPTLTGKYYEKITDVVNGREVRVEEEPKLGLEWSGGALLADHLRNAMIVLSGILSDFGRAFQKAIDAYMRGLALLAKNDLAFRCEPVSLQHFFRALQEALRASGEWDGSSELRAVAVAQFASTCGEDATRVLEVAVRVEEAETPLPTVSLRDVAVMKVMVDSVLLRAFRERPPPDGRAEDPGG